MDTKILRNLVETCPKTQKEIASDLGYSQQRFNFYVNGQREPDVDALCAIASYFGVSVDSLLGRDSTELEKQKSTDMETMPKDETERELIRMAKRLDPERKRLLLQVAAAVAQHDLKAMPYTT